MRRLLSILLLAAFALPIVAPMLALGQDPDSNLPACCRRHGQHHCTMLDKGNDPAAHRVLAPCPAWPQRAVTSSVVSHHFVGPVSSSGIPLRAIALATPPSQAHLVHISERLHPKRGPPAESFRIE